MRRSLPLVDRFLAPSVYVRDRMRLSHLAIECDVLPHFVPAATEGAPKATQAYYFFAGRLEKLKGLQTVIPVFGKTGRQLVIAGAGTYEEELRRQAKPFPNIRFLGRLSTQLLFPWYSGAKATIVPSICPETFGLTCVESLQAGTPVIASRFGALPELVADTGGGAVYGDTRELEAILDGIDHDPDRWVRLGKMGKSRLDKYSAQSHLENYFRIIDAVRPARANTP